MSSASREPHWWTATETIAALKERRIGAVELLDHMAVRQETHGGRINAVVEQQLELARVTARTADEVAVGGPLGGLPMTVKDTYEVAGFGCRAGIPDLADHRPSRDADSVARLKAAGAVIWGKTNVPVAASDHQSYNPLFGVTNNPWNLERSPGGSSGGSAAALAAGLTSLEIGSDIGGSIRNPAHHCGVWGHKPTYGIVSQRGHVPPMPGALAPSPMSVCGPMARSTADLELALDVMTQNSPTSPWSLRLPEARGESFADFRVAVVTDGRSVDPDYAAAIVSFGQALAAEGATVTEVHADGGGAPVFGTDDLYLALLSAVIGAGQPPEQTAAILDMAGQFADDSMEGKIIAAMGMSMAERGQLIEQQAKIIAAWEEWFRDFDALICPVAMNVAFPHQTEDGFGWPPQLFRTLTVGDGTRPYLENLHWPGVAVLGHLPATARPLPEQVHGMPAGVQIIGPQYGDRSTLRLSALCDQAFGGFVPPPGFD